MSELKKASVMYTHAVPEWAAKDVWSSSLGVWFGSWDTSVLTNRYKLLKQLGEGAYGMVALAHDTLTGKQVAIKRSRWNHPRRDESHPTRLLRETQLLLELRGLPNLLQIQGVLVSKSPTFKEIYVVTEAMDADLTLLFERKVQLVEHHLRWWGYKLTLALALLHAKGIVHRDLKPENVFITEACDLVVGDFGLARVVGLKGGGGGVALASQTQHVCSRWYRPPEACLGKASGPSIDIWSLGCLLAEIYLLVQPDAERKPLFPGLYSRHSPVVADLRRPAGEPKYAQMEIIRSVIGCPKPGQPQTKENTWDGKEPKLTDETAAKAWQDRFPGVAGDLLDLMLRCLQWEPSERPSAVDLLEHPAFASVRSKATEEAAFARVRASDPCPALADDLGDEGRRAMLREFATKLA